MQPRRAYRSDLSDERWALIEPVLAAWRVGRGGLGIKQPTHDLWEIVNAILYVSRTGIPWDYLPHDFLTVTWNQKPIFFGAVGLQAPGDCSGAGRSSRLALGRVPGVSTTWPGLPTDMVVY